jgi:hypothetical protein
MSSFEVYVKSSSEIINKELETARKKKQTLHDLLSVGKISQSTHDYIAKNLDNTINEIESRQKVLADKITSRINELEEETRTLEMFLANLEIGYVAGEIDQDLYERESKSIALGLENARRELTNIRDTLLSIIPEATPEPVTTQEIPETPEPVEETAEAMEEEAVVEESKEEVVESPVAEEEEEVVETEEAPITQEEEEMPVAEGEVYFEAPPEELEELTAEESMEEEED